MSSYNLWVERSGVDGMFGFKRYVNLWGYGGFRRVYYQLMTQELFYEVLEADAKKGFAVINKLIIEFQVDPSPQRFNTLKIGVTLAEAEYDRLLIFGVESLIMLIDPEKAKLLGYFSAVRP